MNSLMRDALKSFKRSWVHHTGMQLATMSILTATLTVIASVATLSLNLQNILAAWGDSITVTVYLQESIDEVRVRAIGKEISEMNEVGDVDFVPREVATAQFRDQMATYAPSLLNDEDFASPFPSSYRVHLKNGVRSEVDVKELEKISAKIGKIPGVEDVSFGQGWVHNFSSFVSALAASGGVMIAILMAGALFVIGNSIRASISTRRDEIEILELVGATAADIRRPFVTEGIIMGTLAAFFALVLCYSIFAWQMSIVRSSLALGRLASVLGFLNFSWLAVFLLGGAMVGGLGAWLTVRKINDGWSALQR